MKTLRTGAKRSLWHDFIRYWKRLFRPKLARAETPYDWVKDALMVTNRLIAAGFADAVGKMLARWAKDQKQSDSCGGQALSYGLALANAVLKGIQYIALSAKSIYSLIFYPGGGGTTIGALEHQGQYGGAMTEVMVPSNDANGNCTEEFMEDTSWHTMPDGIIMSQYEEPVLVEVENSVEAIAEAIRDHCFIVWQIDSDFTQVENWLSRMPVPTALSNQGHFMNGYNAQILNDVKTIYFSQSWGVSAGDEGTQYFNASTFIGNSAIKGIFTLVPATIPNPVNPTQQIPNPAILTWQQRLVNYFIAYFNDFFQPK